MSPYFLAFLCMLVAFLLLAAAAAARSMWRRLRPDGSAATVSIATQGSARAADWFLLVGVAAAWYNVASGWICQLTIYPMYADMSSFGAQAFHGFSRGYLSRTPIIILPAGVLCLAWGLLLWFPCGGLTQRRTWLVVALCLAFIAVTPFAAGAQDQMFDDGFVHELNARLLWANAVRSVIFTLIGLVSLGALRDRWANVIRDVQWFS